MLKKGEKIIQLFNLTGVNIALTNKGRLIRFKLKWYFPKNDESVIENSTVFDDKIELINEIKILDNK